MKFLFLVSLVVFLSTDGESVPVEQDTRREDLLAQCLVQILSKALYKTDAAPLHSECKNILKPGSGHSSVVKKSEDAALKTAQEDVKRPSREPEVNEEETIEDLLKADKEKHELNDERSQEGFPSFVKRRFQDKHEEVDDERSQEDFPSFVKRRLKDKREEQDDERSQEDFPSYYKRSSKDKREDSEDERSQEEFPQKRHFSILHKEKRDNPDEERSQEEFPPYQYKRSRLLSSKDKREDTDYDRSQEDFPSYTHKRNHGDEEEKEEDEREKQIWKPSHRYHHKKMLHKRDEDSENENFEDQDYDRSQEDFPSYTLKRNHVDEDDEEDKEEREKRIWKPSHRYHHKEKLHKRNGDSAGDMNSKESEEVDEDIVKRSRKPSSRNHHKKYHKRSGDSSEEDYEEQTHKYPPKYNHKRVDFMDFENEDEPKIDHELNEKRHSSNSQGEEDEQKRHQSSAEEEQDKEAALRYLTKKKNELEERLLNKVNFDEKRSPWIYRGYYHPAWYKRSQDVSTGPHYSRNLEEIAETLRYKRGLLSQQESLGDKKDVPH
ncbi:sarcoplasmic reticulum histidine-rich calcium-binding protein-like [Myxocyprinus asiaticus]|uniref:sarcoplasmic reticulum histidine-rich calcium-binding protein-like n=1 Tax=Myxocyprinus asiaticus TaxID=70543 RepID=UPI002223D843|nr:sarcoplasmic reticulum histidine-rich calcium-binding protein-like [Myxocyprinus asiaticus]